MSGATWRTLHLVAACSLGSALLGACTPGLPTIDDKMLAKLSASERGDIDRHLQRLDIVTRYRAQTKSLYERTQSEVDLVERAKTTADAVKALAVARETHATTHVGASVEAAAKSLVADAQANVDVLTLALAHVKLRRDYMESYDIAAEDAVTLSTAELEKTKVSALAAAKKIEEGKIKISEFDVAVREAKTRYSSHIEAASKVRVALVKAKQAHDTKRLAVCPTRTGLAVTLLHCTNKNGAPWAMTLPEAETLDKLQQNALDGKAPPENAASETIKPLENDVDEAPPPGIIPPPPPTAPPATQP